MYSDSSILLKNIRKYYIQNDIYVAQIMSNDNIYDEIEGIIKYVYGRR